MDVHTTNYTLCAFTLQGQTPFAELQIKPEITELEKYLTMLNSQLGGNCRFQCGYEAGCLGYSLYHEINSHKWKEFVVECVILAPTTMAVSQKNKVKKTIWKMPGVLPGAFASVSTAGCMFPQTKTMQ